DVLHAAGFKHGVNYVTQRTLPSGSRPDVTFLLPGELSLHMDVKFPLANYLAMLECDGEADQDRCRKLFLRDVRGRVKELGTRGYVDPESGTVDFVLLFLPNEYVFGYVHEQDPALLDDALRQGVVMCSPSTLFAVLAVVRQACDGVALQRTSDQIVGLLSGFAEQWGRYTEEVDKLGRQLDTVRRTYDGLATTRRRQLERQLERVEEVREQRGIAPVTIDERPRLLRLPDVSAG
ncbi:MAG: DNA recombination protein RmuC, partial [Actinobacteria bacterium]|nr:DNA recombination protein RmuC [Actinomycetota bacterium]